MPRGGHRPGAGRKAGSRNRATLERELRAQQGLAAALNGGPLPLVIMLCRMNGDRSITEEMFAAAVAAAPYIHPRLQSSDTTIKSDNVHRVVADRPMSIEEWQGKYAHANGAVAAELLEDERKVGN